ncbi:MAG: hypothetical protein OXG35_17205 [Acidobacteria bacterium]|nr:hypothetical protein [Acidobacteriota bacterium]
MRQVATVAVLLCLFSATANGQNVAFGTSATSIGGSGHVGWFLDVDLPAWRGLSLAMMGNTASMTGTDRGYVGAGPRYRVGIGRVEVFGHAGLGLFIFDNLWMGGQREAVFRPAYGGGLDWPLTRPLGIRASVTYGPRAHSKLSDIVSVTPTTTFHLGAVWRP